MLDYIKMSPRELVEAIQTCLSVNLVPFIRSSPGMGKSEIMKQIADSANLELIDLRGSSLLPEDIQGMPIVKDGITTFCPFDVFPLEDTLLPVGKMGWLLFLDEFTQCEPAVLKPMYKLILDKTVGQKKLHPRVWIALAGNLDTDNAMVSSIGTALQSRVVHLYLDVSYDDWLQDVALPRNYDPRIIGYISFNINALNDFNPSNDTPNYCCSRTWHHVNLLISDVQELDPYLKLLSGTISPIHASGLIGFSKVYQDLVPIETILNNPHMPPPRERQVCWAMTSFLAKKATTQNLGKLVQYIENFDIDFRILFFRTVAANSDLQTTVAFKSAMVSLAKYLRT